LNEIIRKWGLHLLKTQSQPILKYINIYIYIYIYIHTKSYHSSAGTVTGNGMDGRASSSLPYSLQTNPGAHPASYPMGTGVLSSEGGKAAGA
jgi:hypothetical protein